MILDAELFAENLEQYGDLLDGFLGAIGPEHYDDLGGEVIVQTLLEIDLGAADFDSTVFGGDDISGAIAVLDELQIDQLGDEYLAEALDHIGITDFHWTGEVASNAIGVLGVDDILGSGDAEGIFGSFDLESADLLGETLGGNLAEVIADLDFDLHTDLLDGSAFLDAIDPDALADLQLDDIAGLFNSGADIFQVDEDNLSVALDALLGGDGLDLVDDDAFGGAIAGLSDDLIFDIFDSLEEAGALLDAVDADLFGSDGSDFDGIIGGDTAFDLFADLVDTVLVDGEDVFSAVVEDGGVSLDDDALYFFAVLFG